MIKLIVKFDKLSKINRKWKRKYS